jgi:hypothetical protein
LGEAVWVGGGGAREVAGDLRCSDGNDGRNAQATLCFDACNGNAAGLSKSASLSLAHNKPCSTVRTFGLADRTACGAPHADVLRLESRKHSRGESSWPFVWHRFVLRQEHCAGDGKKVWRDIFEIARPEPALLSATQMEPQPGIRDGFVDRERPVLDGSDTLFRSWRQEREDAINGIVGHVCEK